MRLLARVLFITGLLGCLPAALAAETFPGVKKAMTPEEFAAAGLAKLGEDELAELDRWIARHTGQEVATEVAQQAAELRRLESAPPARESTPERIVASIVQPFAGWDGRTRFILDNGQIWQQRLEGRYRYSGDDTRVVIQRNFFGFYVMTLTATGRAIGVERVR